jgi:hypothetical protein
MVRMNFDPSIASIEETQGLSVSVYPNPANDLINIKSTLSEGNITIFDMTGKLLINQQFSGAMNSINTSELKNGIYNLTISNGEKTSSEKLIIQK